MRSNVSARRIATLGALLAISLVLSIVESMLGALVPLPIPGVKLGLANIVSIFILVYFSLPSALVVAVLRTFLSALLTGGLSMFLFSAPGAILSILIMRAILRFVPPFSLVGVSMLGAVMHNLAQVCVAVLITGEINLFYYAFVLTAVGAVSGSITGIVAGAAFNRAAGALRIKRRAPYILQSNQGGVR